MTVSTFGQYSSSDLHHDVCTAKGEPVSHNSVSRKVRSLPGITEIEGFSQKATPSMMQDKNHSWFVWYLFCLSSPNTLTITLESSPVPQPPRVSNMCGAAPRWRSLLLQRRKKRPRWAWARAGRSEPSVGTKGWAGPLSRLAPGGCAGSWRPQ